MNRSSFHFISVKHMKNFSEYAYVLLLVFVTLMQAVPALAQDREKLERERKKLEKEIEFTKKLLEETKENKKISYSQLEALKQQIALREKVIGNIMQEKQLLDEQLGETSAIIDALENDLEELKTEYAGMLYNIYKNRSSINQLIFIFNAESFNDAFMRIRYLQQFSRFRRRQAELIEETRQALERKKQEQENRIRDKQKLLEDEQKQREKLQEEIQEKDRLIASLQQQEASLKEEIARKQRDMENLNKKINEIIARIAEEERKKAEAARKKATAADALSLTPEAARLSADFASNQGRLPWPVEKGIISQGFGKHTHPLLKHVEIKNNGIDIRTHENAQVRSIFTGTVVTVMYNPGFQRAVMLRHGEFFTVYSNLKEVFVRSGDEVSIKQPLGLVYTDSKDGESKVHLEIWRGQQPLNPALWIYPNNQ
ncbi:MAG: peptidase M23 [Chitinophagales bacterium]|nr:MAG: peptidase M23 [Chitinophagales bacterium]